MPTITCPIEGYEHIKITYPDVWLMRHAEQFGQGWRAAGDNASVDFAILLGCIALCDKIEGMDKESPLDWPLEVFTWLKQEVYEPFNKARVPEKNLSSPAPNTQNTS